MIKIENKLYLCLAISSSAIILFFLPLILQINFLQNDDWVYYINVNNFLIGNFSLDPVTSSTFYTQGLIGMIYSFIFGSQYLPILTFILYIASFIALAKIIDIYWDGKLHPVYITVLSLIGIFIPLVNYSSIGFMTDIYMMFFLLISFYNLLIYYKKQSFRHFVYFLVALTLAFFVRQIILFAGIGILMDLLIKKDKKASSILLIYLSILTIYFFMFFPSTQEMSEKSIILSNFTSYNIIYQRIRDILIYITAFFFPFMLMYVISKNYIKRDWLVHAGIVLIAILVYFSIYLPYFPHIPNTFTSKGYFPGDLIGNKYYHKYFYDFYEMWNLIIKLTIAVLTGIIILNFQKTIHFLKKHTTIVFPILVYVGMIIVAPSIFDRYYIPIIFMSLILIPGIISSKSYFNKFALFSMLFVFIGISYIYTADYIKWHTVVNSHLEKTISDETLSININETSSTRANNLFFNRNSDEKYKIMYSFDDSCENLGYLPNTNKIAFNSLLFVNPIIYYCY